jgi:hypothetical protein
MEWKLTETKKEQYYAMLKNAQDIEANIGSAQCRIYKLAKLREQIDVDLKSFWEELVKEFNLDTQKDFMIDLDGIIKEVPSKNTPAVKQFIDKPKEFVADLK